MGQADRHHITAPLSSIIKNPQLKAIFRRAERDQGDMPVPELPYRPGPTLAPANAAARILELI